MKKKKRSPTQNKLQYLYYTRQWKIPRHPLGFSPFFRHQGHSEGEGRNPTGSAEEALPAARGARYVAWQWLQYQGHRLRIAKVDSC